MVLLAWTLSGSAGTRARRRLGALAPALVLLLVGLAGKATVAYLLPVSPSGGWGDDWQSVVERSFIGQADLFTFGMALAVIRVDLEDGLLQIGRRARQATAAVAIGAYLVTAKMTSWDQLGHGYYNTLMALAAALFLALVVLPDGDERRKRPALMRFLESRPLIAVGCISYSLFLWHEPVIFFLEDHDVTFGGSAGFFMNVVVVAAVSLFLSGLTYLLVEKPALRRKRRTGPHLTAAPAAVAS